MRKYILLFFSALFFLCACKYERTPQGILKPDDMVKVLAEVHLVDASINNLAYSQPDSIYKYSINRYLQTFKRMRTDSAQFRRSIKYYSKHPDQLQEMYVSVVKILQDKADSLNKPAKQTAPNALPHK